MDKVQRYDCELCGNECNETWVHMEFNEDGGEWVRYEDYKDLYLTNQILLHEGAAQFERANKLQDNLASSIGLHRE
jgi:hypothetical protein